MLTLACSTWAAAQTPTVTQIMSRIRAAYGTRWITGEIADWKADGNLTLFSTAGPKATFPVSVRHRGASQVQRIVTQPGAVLKQGTDGTNSWESFGDFFTTSAQGGPKQFIESTTLRSVQRLLNYQQEGLTLSDLGVNGRTRAIEATDALGRKTTFTLNEETAIITKLEFVVGQLKLPFSGTARNVTDAYVFSDHRLVQSALIPFKIERFNNGRKTEEMQFTAISFNTGLTDQDFTR